MAYEAHMMWPQPTLLTMPQPDWLPFTSINIPQFSHLKVLALDLVLCLECPTPLCVRFLLIILIFIQKSPYLL